MKYKELPKEETLQKLMATCFDTPAANRDIFNWCESLLKHSRFFENERVKLVKMYGKEDGNGNFRVTPENQKEFQVKFNELAGMEIEEPILKNPLNKNWFDNERCQYPFDKNMWLTPAEIGIILKIN